MTKLPMPDAPDRQTARQMLRAAQMTGADVAEITHYVCLAVTKSGDVEMAGNVSEQQLGYLLGVLTEQLESGALRREERDESETERPGLN